MKCLIKPKIKLYIVKYKVVLSTGHKGTGESILTSYKPVNKKTYEDWKKVLIKDIHKQYKYKVKVDSIEIINHEYLNAKRRERLYAENKD